MSYLDYFITSNIDNSNLEIISPIGQSDHFPVMLKFEADQIGELYIRREFTYQFGLVRNNALEISMGLREALKKEKKVDALVELVKKLNYPIRYQSSLHFYFLDIYTFPFSIIIIF